MTSVVLAQGAVEVRAHLVAGAAPGTPVRITGWAARDGVRAELRPAARLDDDLTGVTDAGPTLFVALARLTAEPEPAPLDALATVRVDDDGGIHVRWNEGRAVRVRLADGEGVQVRVSD